MEHIDRRILELLSAEGRMSYTDIGRETGLSTSAAQQRVRRLEQRGVITGYRAVVSPEALGRLLTAFVFLQPADPAQDEGVVDVVSRIEAVDACYSVAGDFSYLLRVRVESPAELEAVLSQIRTGARCSTHTSLVLSAPFEDRPQV